MQLLLTSSGFGDKSAYNKFIELTKKHKYQKAIIITSAHPRKEKAIWAEETFKQIIKYIKNTTFVDFENLHAIPSGVDVVYVCGGNTFNLLKFAKQINFGKYLKDFFKTDGLYIGSSAGAIILSKNISIADEVTPDKNSTGIADLTAFNFIPFHIAMHYRKSMQEEVDLFKQKHKEEVVLLKNGQSIFIKDGVRKLLD